MHIEEQDDDFICNTGQFIETASGDLIEAHRSDDPNVWGLRDVARGRTPDYPVTVFAVSGDNASGVMGRLLPSSEFIAKTPSKVGKTVLVRALAEPDEELEVVWDGVVPTNVEGFLLRATATPEPPVRVSHSYQLPAGEQRAA